MHMSIFNSYKVTVPSIAKHIFQIELTIPNPAASGQILRLPTWIPGSYMVRDFAKNVLWLSAEALEEQGNQTNKALKVSKLDKQTWKIEPHAGAIVISYQVYALDLSVRSAFLDSNFGFANGTSLFLEVVEQGQSPINVQIALPDEMPQWTLASTLPLVGEQPERGLSGQCENYLDLIEYPILMGELDIIPFSSEASPQEIAFELVLVGGHNADKNRLAADLTKIADHHLSLFDSKTPIDRYQFLTILTESDFGGLEHTSSTALVYSRNDLPTVTQKDKMTSGYCTFLSLCSHELFHTWHVKRIKPACFIEPDLSQEVYTEQLWIYEGFTSYYDDFSLKRSNIITNNCYLEILGQGLTRLLRCKGRLNQTVTESSWDTWTKFYKQDENAPNAIVSYYIKGAIVALCLDLKLRLASDGKHTVDNLMSMLWEQYGSIGKGTDDRVIHSLLEQLGYNFNDFLHDALYSTKELPVEELLNQVGVTLHTRARKDVKDLGGKKLDGAINQFGAHYKGASTGIEITQVLADTPAEQAMLAKGDNIIAVNGLKITEGQFQAELDKLSTKEPATLHYFRRGCLQQATLPVQAAEQDTVYLEITDEKAVRLWLKLD